MGLNRWLRYYKWHIMIFIFILLCLFLLLRNAGIKKLPDLNFAFVSNTRMNIQNFRDTKYEIELLLNDSNNDNKKVADIKTFFNTNENEVAHLLQKCIDSKNYDAYIADKEAFEKISDKSVFEDTSIFISKDDDLDYLEDSEGRSYAVSLKNNSIIKRFGINEADNLYIAVMVNMKDGERMDTMKNAMNISGYIIKNKNKYQY